MFGFQGGEAADTMARARRVTCRTPSSVGAFRPSSTVDDQERRQLSSMVKDRSGIPEAQAKSDVQSWMRGKQF